MSTTRYVTGTSNGILTLVARALDPDGNPITTQVAITVSPTAVQPTCYSQTIRVSDKQNTLAAACAQFGVALTYYIGAPRNTFYSTRDCSVIAEDGYYKLDDGSWILLSGGIITQRGSCSTVGVTTNTNSTGTTTVPRFTQPVSAPVPPPVPVTRVVEPTVTPVPTPTTIPTQPTQVDIPGTVGPITVFVPTTTFTPIAPTLVPTTTTFTPTFTPTPEPTFTPVRVPAPQPVFGCTDPSAINYDPNATNDNGTCQYQSASGASGFSDTENINVI